MGQNAFDLFAPIMLALTSITGKSSAVSTVQHGEFRASAGLFRERIGKMIDGAVSCVINEDEQFGSLILWQENHGFADRCCSQGFLRKYSPLLSFVRVFLPAVAPFTLVFVIALLNHILPGEHGIEFNSSVMLVDD